MKAMTAVRSDRGTTAAPGAVWESDPAVLEAYANEFPFAHVADRILALRANLGWTQQELAERAGTTQSVIARAESGRHSFRIDLLDRIASAAGVNWWPQFDPLLAAKPDVGHGPANVVVAPGW